MKKLFNSFSDGQFNFFSPTLAMFSALLLCGAVIGSVTAAKITADANSSLYSFVTNYIVSVSSINPANVNLLDAFFNNFKYHLVVWIFAFTGFGVFLIPVVTAFRGFFLAFAITAFVRLLGADGLHMSIAAFGIQTFFSLPCFLILSVQSFWASSKIFSFSTGRKNDRLPAVFNSRYFIRSGICFAVLFFCMFCEIFITPKLVAAIVLKGIN